MLWLYKKLSKKYDPQILSLGHKAFTVEKSKQADAYLKDYKYYRFWIHMCLQHIALVLEDLKRFSNGEDHKRLLELIRKAKQVVKRKGRQRISREFNAKVINKFLQ